MLENLAVLQFRPVSDHLSRFGIGAKRCRIDEDYKYTCSIEKVATGKVKAVTQALRGKDGLAESNGRSWEEQQLLEQHSANMLEFETPGDFYVVEDASRVGRAAEDTTIYFVFEGESYLSAVLPCQVFTPHPSIKVLCWNRGFKGFSKSYLKSFSNVIEIKVFILLFCFPFSGNVFFCVSP